MIGNILVAAAALAFLATNAAMAQTEAQCDEVRAAVAQYGYKAVKSYAIARMSAAEVQAARRCLTRPSHVHQSKRSDRGKTSSR